MVFEGGGSFDEVLFARIYKASLHLPREHPITLLILTHCHVLSGHQGRHITHGAVKRR